MIEQFRYDIESRNVHVGISIKDILLLHAQDKHSMKMNQALNKKDVS